MYSGTRKPETRGNYPTFLKPEPDPNPKNATRTQTRPKNPRELPDFFDTRTRPEPKKCYPNPTFATRIHHYLELRDSSMTRLLCMYNIDNIARIKKGVVVWREKNHDDSTILKLVFPHKFRWRKNHNQTTTYVFCDLHQLSTSSFRVLHCEILWDLCCELEKDIVI